MELRNLKYAAYISEVCQRGRIKDSRIEERYETGTVTNKVSEFSDGVTLKSSEIRIKVKLSL
jgi:hypothetical protein